MTVIELLKQLGLIQSVCLLIFPYLLWRLSVLILSVPEKCLNLELDQLPEPIKLFRSVCQSIATTLWTLIVLNYLLGS